MAYCYHCMTKLESPDMPFCPECGQKHNLHQAKPFELPAGATLSNNRYLVGECMNEDNYLLTYIGYDLKMDRKVIIREIFYKNIFSRNILNNNKPDVSYDSIITFNEIMKQINRECIALSETNSLTNVAKVYDWFTENNTEYIIGEYVSSTTLSDRTSEIGGYEWEKLYKIMKPLLESLSALHEKNLYHKNIKPESIKIRKTLDGTEELVLDDFGFARPNADSGLSFENSTPYEPVEQRNNAQNEGEYTDIYSTAATIYYAVTGAEPLEKLSKNIDEVFPMLKPYRKSKQLPENVYYALKYALQPDFNTRCQSVETFIKRLETVQKPVTVKTGNVPKLQPPKPTPIPTTANMPVSNPTILASSNSTPEPEIKNSQSYVPNIVDDNEPKPTYNNYAGNPNAVKQTAAVNNAQSSGGENKGGNKGLLTAIIAVACVLVIGIIIAVVLLFNANGKDSSRDRELSGNDESTSEAASLGESSANDEDSKTNITDILDNLPIDEDSSTANESDSTFEEFQNDTSNLNKLLQEAVSAYEAGDTTTTWNNKNVTEATVHDVCFENRIDDKDDEDFYKKNIYYETYSYETYYMVWTEDNTLIVSNSQYKDGYPIESDTTIESLADGSFIEFSKLEKETGNMKMLIIESINVYNLKQENPTSPVATNYINGKAIEEATIHDICAQNNIDDSSDYYSRTIKGITYNMVWTDECSVEYSGGKYSKNGSELNGDIYISDLAEEYNNYHSNNDYNG